MEPDLIMWAIEAQDFISRPKTMKWLDMACEVKDNKIPIPAELQMIDCVSLCGVPLTFAPSQSCGTSRCTTNCQNLYVFPVCRNQQTWLMDECYIHFNPVMGDDKIITVKGLQRAIGNDGYPMIFQVCSTAIADYICWKLCFRYRDDRWRECKRDWFFHKRTAFSELKK